MDPIWGAPLCFPRVTKSVASLATGWEPILSSVRPTEATTLLPSTPDRSESPRSAALEPSPVPEEREGPGGNNGYWIPIVIQGLDCRCPGVLLPGHVPGDLVTPAGRKCIQCGPDLPSLAILWNSDGASLKSHLYSLCLQRKIASVFSCAEIHIGGRIVSSLLMAWRHNRRLPLHKERAWASPIL